MAGMRGDAQPSHLPVMLAQALDGLRIVGNGRYLDGTFGRGGHARAVLDRLGPEGRLLVMDKDPEAIATAHALFSADPRVAIYRGSFADLAHWDETAPGLDGVFFDLGVSSPQLDVAERGFSFGKDGPLDMRMDPESGESAAEWIARADEREIADVLWTYGEEKQSRRIARAIVARDDQPQMVGTAQRMQPRHIGQGHRRRIQRIKPRRIAKRRGVNLLPGIGRLEINLAIAVFQTHRRKRAFLQAKAFF
mgnify:CR=1 FL=1